MFGILKNEWDVHWIGCHKNEYTRDFETGTLVVMNTDGRPYNIVFRWCDGEVTCIKFGIYWRFIAKFIAMRWVRRNGTLIGNKP